jgi:hypothetical protein
MAKIKNVEANYTRDLANCASRYLYIVDCPGGRPMVKGYICPHCAMDTTRGDCAGVQDFKKSQ